MGKLCRRRPVSFSRQTLTRSAPHRTIIAIAVAAGLTHALMVLAKSDGRALEIQSTPAGGVWDLHHVAAGSVDWRCVRRRKASNRHSSSVTRPWRRHRYRCVHGLLLFCLSSDTVRLRRRRNNRNLNARKPSTPAPDVLPAATIAAVVIHTGHIGWLLLAFPQPLLYSSWGRNQMPVSLRPLGARSSHGCMPQMPSTPRAYVE